MTKSVSQMSAAEYKDWLLNNPEEAKKLDEGQAVPGGVPTGFWRNGVWVKYETQTQVASNGTIR